MILFIKRKNVINKVIRKIDIKKIEEKIKKTKKRKITCKNEKIKQEEDLKKLEDLNKNEINIFSTSFKKEDLRRYDIIHFNCPLCGKTRERYDFLMCKECSIQTTNIKKYGVPYSFLLSEKK